MAEIKNYKKFGDLQTGKTYVLQCDQHASLHEIQVLEKRKNSLCVVWNPKTGNATCWEKADKEIWAIFDEWDTFVLRTQPIAVPIPSRCPYTGDLIPYPYWNGDHFPPGWEHWYTTCSSQTVLRGDTGTVCQDENGKLIKS